jgi:plastocyanin
MRVISTMAALGLVLAACGGEKKGTEGTTTDTTATTAAPAGDTSAAAAPAGGAAAAGTGASHDVQMTMVNGQPRYQPEEIEVKPGDVVVFHNAEGGPHNVSFWADSIPSGASQALTSGMPDQTEPLHGPLLVEQGATYQVTIPAAAPAGEYKFYCMPHLAMGMKGELKVKK